MKALGTVMLVLFATFILTGCSEEECKTSAVSSTDTPCLPGCISVAGSIPEFKIVSIEKDTCETSEHLSFIVKVVNVSDKPVRNVECIMHALKDSTIFDTATACFADGEKIMPGEKAMTEVVFCNLCSHSECIYDYIRCTVE